MKKGKIFLIVTQPRIFEYVTGDYKGGDKMKRYALFIVLLLVLVLVSTASCKTPRITDQFAGLQAEIKALSNSLTSTQQELASTKKALTEAQEQTRLLKKQLQESLNQTYLDSTTSTESTIISEPYLYYPYRYYYPPYPFPPSPPSGVTGPMPIGKPGISIY